MLITKVNTSFLPKVALALVSLWAAATVSAMSNEEIRAETDRIAAQYAAAMAHCQTLQGNDRDICSEDAKGIQRVAQAERDAKLLGDADHNYQVRVARAEADYRVAKERCNEMRGDAIGICKKDAEAAYRKAQQDAQVKRVEAPPATSTDQPLTPIAPARSEIPLANPGR
ncbi:hypothetical protein [Comamonas sp. JUb58]|uniref:hypothetical protein n=1 Tax=Comamonas sp. JUb58 TaxID=2485114 RepID=UPI00105EAB96|nr:hypothetical protein [Comamonas sp. JUb58]TDS82270.1 hypothetical protein EDF71_108186 [Comamonas sp. JUb58]